MDGKTQKTGVSVIISFVMAAAVLVFLAVLTFGVPRILNSYISFVGRENYFDGTRRGIVIAIIYAVLVPAYAADLSLCALLALVRRSAVFTKVSSRLLLVISVCCFIEVALFGVLSIFFTLSAVIAFAALFLGVVLLVVKNVIEEGSTIKNENDFTV